MKAVCVLSYQRTGSSWLCDILSGNRTIDLQEIFSKDPMIFIGSIYQILDKIYEIEPSILDTLYKIYDISNFFIDNTSYIKIKNNILVKNPYSIKLLQDIKKIAFQNNFNIVFKIFPEHLDTTSLQEILSVSDINIINYRNSLLNSFISEKKSLISQRWTSLQKERQYLEKLEWNEREYSDYISKVIQEFNYLLENTEKYVLISYEEIHSSKDKNQTINEKIKSVYKDFNFSLKETSVFEKENYIKNLAENFVNQEQFLSSYKHIRTKIYE